MKKSIFVVFVLIGILLPIPFVRAPTVTDTFTDTTQIQVYQNLIVNTTAGLVRLDDNWFSGNWSSCNSIDINSSLIGADLNNFPVLVYLNGTKINWASVQDDLDDIRFTTDNVTLLSYEIENYTLNTEAWLWVRIPFVNSTSDTVFYMYYGNPGAANGEDIEAVWADNNGFVMIHHMVDDTPIRILDSMAYNNDGNKKGNNEPAWTANGMIDSAQHFDGGDDYVSVPDSSSTDLPVNFTLEVWFYRDTNTSYDMILTKGPDTKENFQWRLDANGRALVLIHQKAAGGFQQYSSTNVFTTVEYNYAVVTLTTGGNVQFYRNGMAAGAPIAQVGTLVINENVTYMGRRNDGHYFDGILDEFRISNITRTPEWINATYESGRDNLLDFSVVAAGGPLNVGYLYSINLLSDLNASQIQSFGYNCSIVGAESLRCEFSQDNATWYNSGGILDWEDMSDGENNINLMGLRWGGNFYYRIQFNRGSTPELYDIAVSYGIGEPGWSILMVPIVFFSVLTIVMVDWRRRRRR